MGKKHKHLWENICSFENLWLASRKARLGKRSKQSTMEYEYDLERNLLALQHAMQTEKYTFGEYRQFVVSEPQERMISAAPYADRVMHHAVCNIIEPLLDKAMIDSTFACRRGKGTHRALDEAQKGISAYPWALKLDFRKYFFTIDHELLLKKIAKKITDLSVLRWAEKLLRTYNSPAEYYFPFVGDDLFSVARGRGLPIGNLTSQLFANFYLTGLDRRIGGDPRCCKYVRYMDDCVCFGKSRDDMKSLKDDIGLWSAEERLVLHPDKVEYFPQKNGVRFLGFHLYEWGRRIQRSNLKRFVKRLKRQQKSYGGGEISWESLLQSLNAWTGFVSRERHSALIDTILSHRKFQHPGSDAAFTFFTGETGMAV